MYIKSFDDWNLVKKTIQSEQRKTYVRSGEVRWATVGVNIGSEIDGKGNSFTRPVLIIHVIGSSLALVIPITTQSKKVTGYVGFNFQDKDHNLCIHQMRIISQKRLLKRKGRISRTRLDKIKKVIKEFYSL